jgi:hypothetical protein
VISVSCGVTPIIALSFVKRFLVEALTHIKKGDFSFKVSCSLRYQQLYRRRVPGWSTFSFLLSPQLVHFYITIHRGDDKEMEDGAIVDVLQGCELADLSWGRPATDGPRADDGPDPFVFL